MSIRMLIDASHQEETRVAIVDGNQLEDFDYESSAKKQLKGSIYLAKVTRVEPSLQAAFVDYGGNRHGFLAFSEIHPDYYQIPVADREALIAAEAKANADLLEDEDEEDAKPKKRKRRPRRKKEDVAKDDNIAKEAKNPPETTKKPEEQADEPIADEKPKQEEAPEDDAADKPKEKKKRGRPKSKTKAEATKEADVIEEDVEEEVSTPSDEASSEADNEASSEADNNEANDRTEVTSEEETEVENSDESGDDKSASRSEEEEEERLRIRMAKRLRYKYKIQEVIKKNQIILIQVVKEERGNKGAALTTYLSLPGRYCVLMPNTLHGGGVSRKIANVADRKKLKNILSSLNMPKGHACIIRTAGSDRTKAEIKRDYDYLKRMWDSIRDLTLKSIAPTQIYEEGNLIKRSIRDLYTRDVGEIIVEGERGFKTAKNFMGMLMPSHAKKVKQYDDEIPLFQRYQVENYLDEIYSPTAQLKSGGYIVINPTEALVSIDVNSGRATKEHNIEETALKTNLEAAEEVARQLKLRDMAGLVVIDFIDMEEQRNNRAVERKLKACLKNDRARIQVGRISSFGLMEMSRQRIRVGVLESSTTACPHCEGSGLLRSVESQSLHILRIIEEEGIRARNSKFVVYLPSKVAVYILNNKRTSLLDLEKRYDFSVSIEIDNELTASAHRMEKSGKPSRSAKKKKDSLRLGRDVNKLADVTEEDVNPEEESRERPKRRRRRRRGQQNRHNNNATENNEKTDNVVGEKSETSEENPDHGRRKRRPRRPRKQAQDVTKDAGANETTDQKTEAAEAVEEKPKPRRGRRRKTEQSEKVADKANKSAGKEQAEEEKPKRKRKTTASKKTEETAQKPEQKDVKSEEKPKKPARKRTAKKTEVKTVEETPKAAEPKSDTPKKKGWWSR